MVTEKQTKKVGSTARSKKEKKSQQDEPPATENKNENSTDKN